MSWAVLEEPQHPEVPLPWLLPLTCLRSPVSVAGAEAAAGAQPGSLLQRFPPQRQPDWQRRGRVPGEQLPLHWLPRAGGKLLPSVPWGGGSGAAPGPDEEPRCRLLLGTDGVKEVFSSNPFACPHLCPHGGLIQRWGCGGLTPPLLSPPDPAGSLALAAGLNAQHPAPRAGGAGAARPAPDDVPASPLRPADILYPGPLPVLPGSLGFASGPAA